MRASAAKKLVLLYPRRHRPGDNAPIQEVGSSAVFETIRVGDMEIVGMEVECRRLSRTGGFRAFTRELSSAVVRQGG